jgi:hypothetical protein
MSVLFEIYTINVDKVLLDVFGMSTKLEKSVALGAKVKINSAFEDFLIPMINSMYLTQGSILLPDTMFGVFALSDLNMEYYDDYLKIAVTPTFII